ncbi:MAG: hypothetical protein ACTHNG_11395 [Ginsengibacter sp.]
MKKSFIFVALLFSLKGYSQTILETAFFPIYDSMGVVTYVKKSDVKEYQHPKKGTKIFNYDEKLDTIGYWVGNKKKYVSFLPKKKAKK